MARTGWLHRALLILLVAVAIVPSHRARAVPSFALQTGQPCTSCHIGGYGPQLTPFGRAFKLGGYTQTGGDGWQASVPASVMLLGSYTNTTKGQGAPAAPHYGANGNFAMDQVALFLGGRINNYAGGLVQTTFNGVTSTLKLDNTDLRVTSAFSVGKSDLRLGVDVNNGPTVQDPFNSTYAWGYPFVGSQLAPVPTAAPLLAGGLIGNSIGTTVYACRDFAPKSLSC